MSYIFFKALLSMYHTNFDKLYFLVIFLKILQNFSWDFLDPWILHMLCNFQIFGASHLSSLILSRSETHFVWFVFFIVRGEVHLDLFSLPLHFTVRPDLQCLSITLTVQIKAQTPLQANISLQGVCMLEGRSPPPTGWAAPASHC